ncbi:MAG: bifunctional aspartate kinase/homoserine dehydrogenase I, partial [Deltaproteobacteria bacterium]|nr:bifunctional aspartate kinase/homoserine dehydrogenase I [Deltaproteobacteria bacterium]
SLTYAEAMELAYFGAKVLHPRTVIPAVEQKIPLRIRNIFRPEAPGTTITATQAAGLRAGASAAQAGGSPVKGITSISDMSLVSLEGAGMIGVTGVAARMFKALAIAKINVTLISQGSSEQSICCVVPRGDSATARRVLKQAFAAEFRRGQIRRVTTRDDIAVIAVVGPAVRGTIGVAGKLFSALGRNKINIAAVAQGSSEQNISFVIDETDRTKALNVIHGAFHLSVRYVHVVVIGKGTIGGKLLTQIAEGQERLERDLGLRLRVVGIADRRHFLFRPDGAGLARWRDELAACREPMDLDRFVERLQASRLENLILVDATASEIVAKQYPRWLGHGMSVVTPNKKANTMPLPFYDHLQRLVRQRQSYDLHETCVGAGLPVISTLQDLLDSGDELLHIEAALSGTLGFLFSELETGASFSEAVKAAHRLGYTEPDPRDDLSGTDVARKILILARKAGARLSLPDVRVTPLLPQRLQHGGDVAAFFRRLPAIDADYARKVAAAAAEGKVLRFIGRFDGTRAAIGLKAVEQKSPFGRLRGGDNMVVFTTRRYRTNPLIVQGPGAGPDVTAGGVFADILKVAHLLTSG